MSNLGENNQVVCSGKIIVCSKKAIYNTTINGDKQDQVRSVDVTLYFFAPILLLLNQDCRDAIKSNLSTLLEIISALTAILMIIRIQVSVLAYVL